MTDKKIHYQFLRREANRDNRMNPYAGEPGSKNVTPREVEKNWTKGPEHLKGEVEKYAAKRAMKEHQAPHWEKK